MDRTKTNKEQEMYKFFEEINLLEYLPVFLEENIDMETMRKMTRDDLTKFRLKYGSR